MRSRLYWGMKNGLAALNRFADRHRLALCALLALALSALLAVYNVSSGPLRNLNDIGGWANRALFIGMTAAVQALLLAACALLSRVPFARTALRQLIVTAGLFILLLPINQKTHAYVNVMQPVVRAMDAGGLAAGLDAAQGVSAPMATLVYLITRGPVYDMYLLKLFASACVLLLFLLAVRAADRAHMGLRAEALLAFCVILPQGLMNAACSALPEIAAVTLLALALTLAAERPKGVASALCYGAGCALCGACLYALPAYIYLLRGEKAKRHALAALGVMLAACVPAMLCGMGPMESVGSLFSAIFGLPAYAGGAPSFYNIIPRAALEEIPQYAQTLRHLPALDAATNAQPFYTQAHFEIVMRGLAMIGLAMYLGLSTLALRMQGKSPLHRAMILALGALIVCPNVSSGAWLLMDVLCLYAIFAAPGLRLPACLALFATMCAGAYPMTQEVLLPMVYAFALCLAALCMLLDIIPTSLKEEEYA